MTSKKGEGRRHNRKKIIIHKTTAKKKVLDEHMNLRL